jgi:hypothetical protein
MGKAARSMGEAVQSIARAVQPVGEAVQSVGTAVQSVGEAVQSVGTAEQSVGETVRSRGEAVHCVGEAVRPLWMSAKDGQGRSDGGPFVGRPGSGGRARAAGVLGPWCGRPSGGRALGSMVWPSLGRPDPWVRGAANGTSDRPGRSPPTR